MRIPAEARKNGTPDGIYNVFLSYFSDLELAQPFPSVEDLAKASVVINMFSYRI